MKRKVNVDLQDVNLIDAGISVYTNELTLRLMNYDDLELRGTVARRGVFHSFYNPSDFTRFKFPVKSTLFPSWVIGGPVYELKYKIARAILKPFIHTYNSFIGDIKSDIFLFWGNRAPFPPIKGKVITYVHDIIPLRAHTSEFTPNVIENAKRELYNVIDKAAKIITVSEFSKRDIIEYTHIDASRVDVVYNGVNAEAFQQHLDHEAIRAKYNLPEKYALYFGTCGPRKNVESVIRAYAHLPEAVRKEYVLVITNPLEATKACAAENDVTPCYIDGVSATDKSAVYQMASVLVWPSFYEGFGLPIIEAQAAGTPVVCSNVTSLPEVAGDAAVLVEPMDTEAMAAGIERCLYDVPFRQDLIAKGRENVKRFTWDDAAKKLHDIIMSV